MLKKYILFGMVGVLLMMAACGTSNGNDDTSGDDGSESGSVEETFTFDASFTQEADRGVFDLSLVNSGEEPVKLTFSSGQQYEIVVTDPESGEEVYRYSEGMFFTEALIEEELAPDEEMTWQEAWDYTSMEEAVEPGEYEATVSLVVMSLDGEEVPEDSFTDTVSVTVPEQTETSDETTDGEEASEDEDASPEETDDSDVEENNTSDETASLPEANREGHDQIRNLGVTGEQGNYQVTGETNLEADLNYSVEDGHFVLVEETAVDVSGEGEWKEFNFDISMDEADLPDYGAWSLVFSWEDNGEKQYHSVLLENFNE